MKPGRSTLAWKTLWLPIGCLCMLGYGYASLMKAHQEVVPVWELEPLEAQDLVELWPGDPIWVVGRVDALGTDEEEGTLYWQSGSGADSSGEASESAVPLRGPGYQAQLILSQGPEGELDLFGYALDAVHAYDYSWNQSISAMGTVQSLNPLVVESQNHFAGDPADHARFLRQQFLDWLRVMLGAVVLGGLWLFFATIHFSDRPRWVLLARKRGLNFSRSHPWTRGQIWGEYQGRRICIRQHSPWKGILSPFPWMRLELHHPSGLGVAGNSPSEIRRWKDVLGMLRNRINEQQGRVESLPAVLVLSWPGVQTTRAEHMLVLAAQLAVEIEQIEAKNWTLAANRHKLDMRFDETCWTLQLKGAEDPVLHFGNTPDQPVSWRTRFHSLALQRAVQESRLSPEILSWQIRRRAPSSGELAQRTDDPILDGQLSFEGFEPAALQRLVDAPGATQILMAAVAGHGLSLSEGGVRIDQGDFVRQPSELFDDCASLEALIESAASPSPSSRAPS